MYKFHSSTEHHVDLAFSITKNSKHNTDTHTQGEICYLFLNKLSMKKLIKMYNSFLMEYDELKRRKSKVLLRVADETKSLPKEFEHYKLVNIEKH